MSEGNNVFRLDDYRKPKTEVNTQPLLDYSNWQWLHKSEYEKKIHLLIEEGWIKSGSVVMDDNGIPTVYITPNSGNTYHLDYTTEPEANNT